DDFELGLGCNHVQPFLQLFADQCRDFFGIADQAKSTAAGFGKACEQDLVEIGTDAESGGNDAASAEFGGVRGEHVAIGRAAIGETVGQQQATCDLLVVELVGDLAAALKPATGKVGRAIRIQLADAAARIGDSRTCGRCA